MDRDLLAAQAAHGGTRNRISRSTVGHDHDARERTGRGPREGLIERGADACLATDRVIEVDARRRRIPRQTQVIHTGVEAEPQDGLVLAYGRPLVPCALESGPELRIAGDARAGGGLLGRDVFDLERGRAVEQHEHPVGFERLFAIDELRAGDQQDEQAEQQGARDREQEPHRARSGQTPVGPRRERNRP